MDNNLSREPLGEVPLGQVVDGSFIRPIIVQAGNAIKSLWNLEMATFWRSTEHRSRFSESGSDQSSQNYFPTVTFCAADALVRLAGDFSGLVTEDLREEIFKGIVPSILHRPIEDLRQTSLSEIGGKDNPFTISLYISLLARISSCQAASKDDRELALKRADEAVGKILAHPFFEDDGALVAEDVHPFILYHVARSLRLIQTFLPEVRSKSVAQLTSKIEFSLRRVAEMLFARGHMGLISPSEAVASVFCAAVLAISDLSDNWHYILPGVEIALRSQDQTGCWPLGRVVPENKDLNSSRLEISTYEVAWVVADSLLAFVRNDRQGLALPVVRRALVGLVRAGEYASNSIVNMMGSGQPRKGWCSDHPFGKPLIESWTSAAVLQFALSLQDLIEETNREILLGSFSAIHPRDEQWPSWLRWNRYRSEGEVDHERPILGYIEDRIIKPILSDPRRLPSAKNECVSAVLFGPPGTSKTTVVKAVADALDWPLVMLSPGDFISRGLEYIEAQASSIFRRLQGIQRAVVLFDECDELFRDRGPNIATEQVRGIAAFVTASMLPKLQELHDSGRVAFFICTNNFESLDSAIRRSGRVDHIIGVGTPDKEARLRIARQAVEKADDAFRSEAIEELASATERFTRSEVHRAARALFSAPAWRDAAQARRSARAIAEKMSASLTVTVEELEAFKRSAREYSRPILEGGYAT